MATFECISKKDFSKKANSAYKTALMTLSLNSDKNISIPNKIISALQKLVDKKYSEKDELTVQQKKDIVDAAYDGMISAGLPENVIANPSELYAAFFPGGTMYNENVYNLTGGDFDNGIFDNSTPSERLSSEFVLLCELHQLACSMMKNRFDNLIAPSIFANKENAVSPKNTSINLLSLKLDMVNRLFASVIMEMDNSNCPNKDVKNRMESLKSEIQEVINILKEEHSLKATGIKAK